MTGGTKVVATFNSVRPDQVPTMNTQEARRLIDEQLARYRTMGYTALLRLLDAQDTFELEGAGGTKYQVEISAIWDRQEGGDLRVMGCIDDGGWRAFVPLSSDFIIRPDSTLID
jgi:hypothetical protein